MLVRDIANDSVDREMIRCIHGMARATGKQTIAEFAESDTILQILRDIGIDYAQGYIIGRPQPLASSARSRASSPTARTSIADAFRLPSPCSASTGSTSRFTAPFQGYWTPRGVNLASRC
jgi:predicted signal transduction protein with EAL and GGDEF domain